MQRVDDDNHPLSSSTTTEISPASSHHHQYYMRKFPRCDDTPSEGLFLQLESNRDLDHERQQNREQQDRQHTPLSDPNSVARSPAASLIQSVARSALLDEATPNSTVISDDASDVMSGQYYHYHQSSSTTTPSNLSSLQTPTMPALPDEQDRRRFIGCLAAVLASSYEYDVADDRDNESDTSSNNGAANESVWLGYPDDFWEDDDEDDDDDNNGVDNSFEEKVDDVTKLPKASLSSKRQSTTSDSFYGKRCQSFESLGTQESSKTSLSGKNQSSRHKNRRRRQTTDTPFHRKTSGIFSNNAKEKARLSLERHRHRRYEVLSKLLMSSSELLLMDKTVARAFLPMLSRVLVPECRQLQKSVSADSMEGRSNRTSTMTSRSAPSSPTNQTSNAAALNSSFDVDRMLPSNSHGPRSARTFNKSTSNDTTEPTTVQPLPPMPIDNDDELKPFLESLTPGAGFRCVALMLLQHLLTSETGYDARIRHVLKKLSVIVLLHDMQDDPIERHHEQHGSQDMMLRAARKFEALEHSLAQRLLRLSNPNAGRGDINSKNGKRRNAKPSKTMLTREQIVRGVKIGGAGIVAGTLFALTGGLAAPGIAAGVAAVAGAAAGTAAVATLTSAAVVTTIFGVGGGGLAAYKMQRRTQGVTEFEFYKETGPSAKEESRKKEKWGRFHNNTPSENDYGGIEAELFTVLCISGWLRDQCDYQRPWGVQPTNPRILDRQELLERFYSVHSPEHLPKVPKILESWKGEETKLWKLLRDKYGCDPDNLYPLSDGPRSEGALTLEQEEIVEKLFVELGYNSVAPEREAEKSHYSSFQRMANDWSSHNFRSEAVSSNHSRYFTSDREVDLYRSNESSTGNAALQEEKSYKPPKHLNTVWDWKKTYGGEMYHVKWESELLKRICDCFIDLAMDVVSGATKQILKQTVFHTLLAAVVWPSYLLTAADMIDGDWTLAVERADEAGKVLAKTLLFSRAGRRPVTLVGYSFGGRIIYACLKELARYQEEWETYREMLEERNNGGNFDSNRLAKYESKMKGMREPAGIVEDAVLMGLPNHLSLQSWRACRQIVSGRLVNCYSRKDLILSLMFQAKRFSGGSLNAGMGSFLKPVCGTCAVDEPGVENVDCSDLILGHQDYCMEIGRILDRVRFGQPLRCRTRQLIASVPGLPMEGDVSNDLSESARKLVF
ncbi:DUF726 domain containing protein [Nitzschia inconspicua]|uniref:DUF726 domain containing protein n=1 Tax=Nitzschia inconspicua TaxID=303405 RepID=A0A9K3KLT2_9STRA|nr:DUF726 domain containing protein [Nitzschia inconspicua]